MNRLDVKLSNMQFVLAVLLGFILVPLGLSNLLSGISKGFTIGPIGIGFITLVGYGVVIWLILRGRAKSVKYFSNEGLTRNDGQSFAWTDLSHVVNQIRIRGTRTFSWRTEIHFKNGEVVWLLPTNINNFHEVSEYVRKLPCEHTEERV
jgi:hypothetical protein